MEYSAQHGYAIRATLSYKVEIKPAPPYADAYSNLGKAYQELVEEGKFINLQEEEIALNLNNPVF